VRAGGRPVTRSPRRRPRARTPRMDRAKTQRRKVVDRKESKRTTELKLQITKIITYNYDANSHLCVFASLRATNRTSAPPPSCRSPMSNLILRPVKPLGRPNMNLRHGAAHIAIRSRSWVGRAALAHFLGCLNRARSHAPGTSPLRAPPRTTTRRVQGQPFEHEPPTSTINPQPTPNPSVRRSPSHKLLRVLVPELRVLRVSTRRPHDRLPRGQAPPVQPAAAARTAS
jgi:hypothetical protein